MNAFLLVTALLLPPAAPPQDAADTPNILSIESVRLETFTPQHLSAEELYQVARKTVGRNVYIAERGGQYAEPASNLALMTNRILVYDEPKYVDLILAALRKLDQPDANARPAEDLVAREYAPRFITLDSAFGALQSFQDRNTGVSMLVERNVLVMRATTARVAEMTTLLSSLDRPEPQAILTCYVVRGGASGDAKGLPADLVKNLEALVPQLRFTSVGFGLVRTSVASGRDLALRLETGSEAFELTMLPVAYDPTTASLTVQRCRLERSGFQAVAEPAGGAAPAQSFLAGGERGSRRQIFSTNAVLRGGEYTVLGASGSDPLFLVLHLTPVP